MNSVSEAFRPCDVQELTRAGDRRPANFEFLKRLGAYA